MHSSRLSVSLFDLAQSSPVVDLCGGGTLSDLASAVVSRLPQDKREITLLPSERERSD